MRKLLLFFLLLAVVFGITVINVWREPPVVEDKDPDHLTIKIPEGHSYGGDMFGRHLDISADGKRIVYVGKPRHQRSRLYQHTIGEAAPVEIAGTEGAGDPALSPDGQYVVFYVANTLKRAALDGSGVIEIGKTPAPRGVAWLDAGTLILSNTEGPLLRMPVSGGEPSPLVEAREKPVRQQNEHEIRFIQLSPHVLPGNKAVLFTLAAGPLMNARIAILDLATGEERRLFDENGFAPRYLPTGHIIFAQGPNRRLKVVGFDLAKLEVVGSSQPVLPDALWGLGSGGSTDYAVSTTGTLVYTPRLETDLDEVVRELAGVDLTEIHVRLNWFEELKALVTDSNRS